MSQNFEVTEADQEDLEGISLLLKQRSLHPEEKLWERYCKTMVDSKRRHTAGAVLEDTSLIVIDRIGVVRGFCIIRWRRHPNYPDLLDVPVIAIEKGPNENEIARTVFNHLLNFARCQNFDALRLGSSTTKFWEERTASACETRLAGTIMPLNINPQGRCELSRPARTGSPMLPHLEGRSFGQSRLHRIDAGGSQRRYSRALLECSGS